jgi:hypothetical protein
MIAVYGTDTLLIDEPGGDDMTRLQPLEIEEAPAEAREYYERDVATWGTVLNNTKLYAHNVSVLKALKTFVGAFAQASSVPLGVKSLVRARIAILNGCPF